MRTCFRKDRYGNQETAFTMNVAVIFAGGSGIRMGSTVPKQFIEIDGAPILAHTLRIFQRHSKIDGIYLVCNPAYRGETERMLEQFGIKKVQQVVDGGASAQDSIYNGLKAVEQDCPSDTIVVLHDGVRPCLDPLVITANIESVEIHGNAVTFTPCFETLVISKNGEYISDIPYRRESYAAQAPQSFRLGDILSAHERIRMMPNGYVDMVDQATICWKLGIPIHLVKGNRGNIKVTTPEDVYMLRALLQCGKDKSEGRLLYDK